MAGVPPTSLHSLSPGGMFIFTDHPGGSKGRGPTPLSTRQYRQGGGGDLRGGYQKKVEGSFEPPTFFSWRNAHPALRTFAGRAPGSC